MLFIKTEKRDESAGFEAEETSCMGFSDFIEYKCVVTPAPRGLRKLLDESGECGRPAFF